MFEIERKFLVDATLDEILGSFGSYERQYIEQIYLDDTGAWIQRARKLVANGQEPIHFFTMKKRVSDRKSIELETVCDEPFYDNIARLAGEPLRKYRHKLPVGRHVWEVDAFENPSLGGLIVAEIELSDEAEEFAMPGWLGAEVTHDFDFSNYQLSRKVAVDGARPATLKG